MITCKELLQGNEVVVRLTHLLAINRQHIVVHPVFHSGMSHRSLCLGNLTLVMREDQVHATTVDIKLLAQILPAHSRALTVPARETIAPR